MSKAKDLSELGGVVVTDGSGNVGIGTSSPSATLGVNGRVTLGDQASSGTAGAGSMIVGAGAMFIQASENQNSTTKAPIIFSNIGGSSESMRVDSSGNVLVGKTAADNGATAGIELRGDIDKIYVTDSASSTLICNRLDSDGNIANFQRNGTTIGQIGSLAGNMYIGSSNTGLRFQESSRSIFPCNSNGSGRDNVVDMGNSSVRFDDIRATNGTIQTSDRNDKQQIASLTDAEVTAAKVISTLFKTFKWNDKVEEKGDAARTHTGVIAQDVQQAMTDASLNAGDYAFFISDTWWEADETYTDDDGNAQTRTVTYDTQADAPAGATERTRLGIRYPELLAFVGAATEQRLASIETRLTALEIE